MQSHLGSVVLCLASIAWLGPKFFGAFTRLVVKVYNLCRVFKTDISAVLTVKSGLDPHMVSWFGWITGWFCGLVWVFFDNLKVVVVWEAYNNNLSRCLIKT